MSTSIDVAPGLRCTLDGLSPDVEQAIRAELVFARDSDDVSATISLTGAPAPEHEGPVILSGPVVVRSHAGLTTFTSQDGSGWVSPAEGLGGLIAVPGRADRFVSMTLFPMLVELALGRGILGIHASAIARDGRGVLSTGPSGCGKSTIYRAAFRAGWDTLSEDLAWIRSTEDGPILHPMRRGRLDAGGPPSSVASAPLCAIILPSITHAKAHEIRRVSPKEALAVLVQEAGFLSTGSWVAARFGRLAELAARVPAYSLGAGVDTATTPEIIWSAMGGPWRSHPDE